MLFEWDADKNRTKQTKQSGVEPCPAISVVQKTGTRLDVEQATAWAELRRGPLRRWIASQAN